MVQKFEGAHVLNDFWNSIENSKKYISIEGADVYMYQRKHPEKHGLIVLRFGVQDGVAHTLEIRAGTINASIGSNDIDHIFVDADEFDIYIKNSGVTIALR